MKTLFLFSILLLISCTDNKQSTENSTTQPIEVVEEIIEPPVTNPTIDSNLIASYVDDDLVRIFTAGKIQNIPYYCTIYYNTNTYKYYGIVESYPTNGLIYQIDTNKSTEPYWDYTNDNQMKNNDPLVYLGTLPITNSFIEGNIYRAYLDTNNNQQYIKIINQQSTEYYYQEGSGPPTPNPTPDVYPILTNIIKTNYDSNIITNTHLYHTNSAGAVFDMGVEGMFGKISDDFSFLDAPKNR